MHRSASNNEANLFASCGLRLDLSVGAGGALTILSDPGEEWREVLLKSRSVVPRYFFFFFITMGLLS